MAAVLVRVLQRNKTKPIEYVCVCVCVRACVCIYEKELAHIIMEAEKFQDL